MLHTVPDLVDTLLGCVARELEQMVGWVFVTSVGVQNEFWLSFSPLFDGLVGAVDSGGAKG